MVAPNFSALTAVAQAAGASDGEGASIVINLVYLVAAVMFIFGLKGLTHPRTAVRGNMLGASAMLLALVVTLFDAKILTFEWILVGLVVGTVIGAAAAIRVAMTQMPEMVAIFNGFGGLASLLVAGAETADLSGEVSLLVPVAAAAAGIIGAVTFWGSMVAYCKLAGKLIPGNAIIFRGQLQVSVLLIAVALGFGVWLAVDPGMAGAYWLLVVVASVLGVISVIRIGGGDMPVVIALLNSYSGLAAAATGFVIGNNVLIVAGSLVGASGLILTSIMCKAMNRSLPNVLFGVLGPGDGAAGGGPVEDIYEGRVKATSPDEIAMLLDVARTVIIAPGYGMAVAQAQHAVRDLANELERRGVDVQYAIHPVAGRMPGHMNVLLAEADVPYEQLHEMDEINSSFEQTDLVIVLGANDVVNPLARTDPHSPIAGMPILDVDKAKTVIMIKRSLSPGFAGIPNPLFAADNCLMFFSDGKKAVLEILAAVKEN